MRFRLRTLMIAVAAVGLILGLVAHIKALVREEDDFALPILITEGVVLSMFLAVAGAVGFSVWVVREDQAYSARLRRDEGRMTSADGVERDRNVMDVEVRIDP